MWPSAFVSGVTIREMLFSVRSNRDSKHPAEIALIRDDSGGKPREPCRKWLFK